jgi:hypothetical protein
LARDVQGGDVALARIDIEDPMRLVLATEPFPWGAGVIACGYPLTTDTRDPTTGDPHVATEARVLRGYVTRILMDDLSGQEPMRAFELDMRAPAGMSGSPLLNPDTLEVGGLVYGTRTSYQPGEEEPFTFSLAMHLDVLRKASGPATDGLPLCDFLAREQS